MFGSEYPNRYSFSALSCIYKVFSIDFFVLGVGYALDPSDDTSHKAERYSKLA